MFSTSAWVLANLIGRSVVCPFSALVFRLQCTVAKFCDLAVVIQPECRLVFVPESVIAVAARQTTILAPYL